MADYSVSYESGLAAYGLAFDPVGSAWNGTAFVDRSTNWAACATPMTDTGNGLYEGSMPATLASGTWLVQSYLRLTGSPLETDPIIGTGYVEWRNSAVGSSVDLITSAYAVQVLAAGGVTLTTEQETILSTLITAASREIIRYCSRQFALTTYTEIVTPEGGRQDRGEPASAKLSTFPVQSITSVLTNRSSVLTITNTDATTNQYASVAFTLTGDVEYQDLVYTGLTLSRMASGVTSANTLAFASNVTIQALANAVNALGNGWSATVQGNYGLYPSASLVGAREPKDALSQGACLDLFTKPASRYEIDRSTGIMRCSGIGSGFGGYGGWDSAWDDAGGYGGVMGWNSYQVTYQAGWSTIPENLQLVCAEVVKGVFARLDGDPSLKSESADKYSYTVKDAVTSLPEWAQSTLMYYRNYSV